MERFLHKCFRISWACQRHYKGIVYGCVSVAKFVNMTFQMGQLRLMKLDAFILWFKSNLFKFSVYQNYGYFDNTEYQAGTNSKI